MSSHDEFKVGTYDVHFAKLDLSQRDSIPIDQEILSLLLKLRKELHDAFPQAYLLAQMSKCEDVEGLGISEIIKRNKAVTDLYSDKDHDFYDDFFTVLAMSQFALNGTPGAPSWQTEIHVELVKFAFPHKRYGSLRSAGDKQILNQDDLPWPKAEVMEEPTKAEISQEYTVDYFIFTERDDSDLDHAFQKLRDEYMRMTPVSCLNHVNSARLLDGIRLPRTPICATIKFAEDHKPAALEEARRHLAGSLLTQIRNLQRSFDQYIAPPILFAVLAYRDLWDSFIVELQGNDKLVFWQMNDVELSSSKAEDLKNIEWMLNAFAVKSQTILRKWWTEHIKEYLRKLKAEKDCPGQFCSWKLFNGSAIV